VAISLVPSWMHNDARSCNAYLAKLLAKTSDIYHSMGITAWTDCCSATLSHGRQIYSTDRPYYRLARTTGKFSIGEYQIGRVTRQQSINSVIR